MQDELVDTYFAPGKHEARFAWEQQMEDQARKAFGEEVDILLYCPKRRMQLKEAKTMVRFPGHGDHTMPLDSFVDDIPRLRDLADSYPRMWKLYVFTSLEDKSKRRKLQEMSLKALPAGCRNALVL